MNYSVGEKEKAILAQRQLEELKELSESELTSKIDISYMYDDDAYFVRAEKYFMKYVKEFRSNIDETFNTYYEERVRRTETTFGALGEAVNLINRYRKLEDYSRKELTRRGLNILCNANRREDLMRIKKTSRMAIQKPQQKMQNIWEKTATGKIFPCLPIPACRPPQTIPAFRIKSRRLYSI